MQLLKPSRMGDRTAAPPRPLGMATSRRVSQDSGGGGRAVSACPCRCQDWKATVSKLVCVTALQVKCSGRSYTDGRFELYALAQVLLFL